MTSNLSQAGPDISCSRPTIGILGGGQLARMLIQAGSPMGFGFVVLDPVVDSCSAQLAPQIIAEYDDHRALTDFAEKVDVITFDFENVPASTLRFLNEYKPVFPGPEALEMSQDRLTEKQALNHLGLTTAHYAAVDDISSLTVAAQTVGLPAILKTRRMGYDGKGQVIIRHMNELDQAFQSIHQHPAILEGFVDFDHEVSLIAVRTQQGQCEFYPLVENEHQHGILACSRMLKQHPLQQQAERLGLRLLEHLDYVGVLTIEFFVCGQTLMVNEIAPRVHNSGHWSIEGAQPSQFENHLRAVCDLPITRPEIYAYSAMVNFIGQLPDPADLLSIPATHYHDYGKTPRVGRKVGHVTVCAENEATLEHRLQQLRSVAAGDTRD